MYTVLNCVCGCCRYLAESPVILTSVEEAQQFLDGKLPADVDSATHTAVLGLYDHSQKTGWWVGQQVGG